MNKIQKNIVFSYNNLSIPVKASLWFAICSIIQKGVSLLSIPIFTRILTTDQYGIYSVYQSWYDLVKLFATLNLYAAVFNNGMIKYERDKKRFISSIQGLATTITCSMFLVYLVNINFWNSILGLPTILIVIMFIDLIFSTSYSFWTASQRFDYKYKKIIVVTILIAILSPILGVLAVLSTQYKSEARIISFALVQIVIGIVIYVNIMKQGKIFFHKEYWKYALKFNIPLLPHYLSLIILQQSDRIMIARLVGEDKAAIYSIAYSISTIMIIVTTAINNSLVPYTYKALKNKEYTKLKNNVNGILILVALICILVMAFAPEVIRIFGTSEYYEAIWVIPPVAASVYYMFLYPVFSNISFYFEENKFIMIASCTGAALNIILNFIFIPKFGYIAAGYTTLVCYMLFGVAHYFCYKKVIKKNVCINDIYCTKSISIISIILLVIMIVMLYTYKNFILRYFVIFLISLLAIYKRDYIIKRIIKIKRY